MGGRLDGNLLELRFALNLPDRGCGGLGRADPYDNRQHSSGPVPFAVTAKCFFREEYSWSMTNRSFARCCARCLIWTSIRLRRPIAATKLCPNCISKISILFLAICPCRE